MLRQFLLFPDSPHLLASRSRRLTPFRALLELENGLVVSVIISQRDIPDVAQLAAIAPTLAEAVGNAYPLTHATDLIHERHGIAVEVVNKPFADVATWNVAAVVNGCLASATQSLGTDGLSSLRQRLLDETLTNLRRRLDAFLEGLDREIVARLEPGAELHPMFYNYLAGSTPVLRRNRMQAARLYPWLTRHVLWNECLGALPARVHKAIDDGEPLVEAMAGLFEVASSVIKALSGCPGEILAKAWRGDVRRLAWALNGIVPEYRPQSDEEWGRMGETVTLIERITGNSIARPQNRLWLAAAARTRFVLEMPDLGGDATLSAGLTDLRSALRQVLGYRVSGDKSWDSEWLARHRAAADAVEQVMVGALGHMQFTRLLDIVRRWQDAFRRQQSDNDEEHDMIRGMTWVAPMDRFMAEDRVIVSLLSAAELIDEGAAMDHCVGSYACSCRMGSMQVWSVRKRDGTRCSTLATTFVRRIDGGWTVAIRQHRACHNEDPDPLSKAAAKALVRSLSASHAELKQFWEWRQTLARLSLKDRGMLVAIKALSRSLDEVLPKKLGLDALTAGVNQLLEAGVAKAISSAGNASAAVKPRTKVLRQAGLFDVCSA
jgi:hypothetical protein